jgi:hypothetical protein
LHIVPARLSIKRINCNAATQSQASNERSSRFA